MKKVILLRYGEIHLKGKNRGFFERILLSNLTSSLRDIKCKISRTSGRYLISDFNESSLEVLVEKCSKIFGFVSLSVANEIDTDNKKIEEAMLLMVKKLNQSHSFDGKTFCVNVVRADKTFEPNSMQYEREMGKVILDNYPTLKVKLKNPEIEINIDIRENKKTYIFVEKIACVGGMPVGTAGSGLLMLSGGIDSPVAGYMMAKRGIKLSAVHFYSFPYTSVQAKDKVLKLAEILSDYSGNIKVYLVPFTKVQEQIHTNCDSSYMINIMRRIMIRIAERICKVNNLKTIITGESLGQVASQTIESITTTNFVSKTIPILRPLIGFDKSEIVEISKKINTFKTSILPYEDCCTVFLPKNPIIKPKIENCEAQEKFLNIEDLVNECISKTEIIYIKRKLV